VFTFVTDGVASAIEQAKNAAGGKAVQLHGATVMQDVVPVVFGSGKRYFGPVEAQHLLDHAHMVIQGDRVLHLRYRVRR